jgi:hypothetical protein
MRRDEKEEDDEGKGRAVGGAVGLQALLSVLSVELSVIGQLSRSKALA